jgi:hypothetical protein
MKDNVCILVANNYVVEQVLLFFEKSPVYDTKINRIKTPNELITYAENVFFTKYAKWAYEKTSRLQTNWPPWLITCFLTEAYSVFIDRMLFEWQICLKKEKVKADKNIIDLASRREFLKNRSNRELKKKSHGPHLKKDGGCNSYTLFFKAIIE